MICLSQVYHVYVIYMYMFVHVYIQVKDRFCSLLSDQVASLQDQLSQMRLDKTPEPEEPSSSTENSYRPNYAQEVRAVYMYNVYVRTPTCILLY